MWSDVMDMAQANSWAPSVLAASQSWLPVYRASGLVDHYIGDEAIVDCTTFTLKGKSMKSLRGAYNRMKKSGCRVECFDRMDAVSAGAAEPAARADDRDPPGRGRARLLDDAEPHLRPPRHGAPAGRVLRCRRPAAGLQPVRPGQPRSTATRST